MHSNKRAKNPFFPLRLFRRIKTNSNAFTHMPFTFIPIRNVTKLVT